MPISYLDIAGTYSGPGAYSYNVATWPGGAVLFVNSATGLDGRARVKFTGTPSQSGVQPQGSQGPTGDPNFPLASVFGANGALSFCKAGRGDIIIVAPNHVETLATGAVITVPDNVTILGAGYGKTRPTFQFTVLGTFITFGGCAHLNNLVFDLTQVAALVKGFLVNTNGVQFAICRFIEATATNQATDCIVLNAGADDFVMVGCEIDASGGVSARGVSNPTTNTINRTILSNNYIHGQFSTGPISFLSTASAELLIEYNTLRQEHGTTTFAVSIAAGNNISAVLSYNDLYSSQASGLTQAQFYSNTLGTGIASIQNFAVRGGATATAGTAI